MRSFSHKVSLF